MNGARAAHPRSRGENSGSSTKPRQVTGSSPLTRGKRALVEAEGGQEGLIPAHAGKTRTHPPAAQPRKAHPRSRGENPGYTPGRDIYHGSSPLTRGKPVERRPRRIRRRLIPAHAGKTDDQAEVTTWAGAHPRSRGENDVVACREALEDGSSPLTRGKRNFHASRRDRGGLIPAHAGKTQGRRRSRP